MTCKSRAQIKGTDKIWQGTGHRLGTGSKTLLCPHKYLFSFIFFTKGHRGTEKEGGIREMGKTAKTAQKGAKREEYKEHQRSREYLCPVPFSKTGAMA